MADESKTNGRNETMGTTKSESDTSEKQNSVLVIGKLKLRGQTDDLPQDWWFASTAIPLLAATIGPLANVLSIAALVSKWRVALPNNGQLPEGADNAGVDIADPHWEIVLNALSLACGFVGNFCLLLNFTQRIRYIIALPATIIFWYFATGLLIGTCAAMNHYVPPIRPGETYSQGFWYAIIAAVLYLVGSMMLMCNMIGYFLGHYPQHFDLDDHQRTLILQTMMFFFWLAGGAAIFSKVCGWSYADALYFCDVTVLTIGFGDLTATDNVGRGLVFPYAVFGIIFLGLMINSIRKFAASMSSEKIIRKHQLNERERTFGRSVTSEKELRDRLGLPPKGESQVGRRPSSARKPSIVTSLRRSSLDQYGRFDIHGRTITFYEHKAPASGGGRGGAGRVHKPKLPLSRDAKMQLRAEGKTDHARRARKREKLIMLKEEKDRFNAMREIQANTSRFKQYYALAWSILAFGILWCIGALVFMFAEERMQGLSYFQSLYFCYVSLLTIGYGDYSPKSNAGKPFFVVWSLVAIPTMTILVSDMGDTVVSSINRGTFTLADWTVMPKAGIWHDFLEGHPKLRDWLVKKTNDIQAKKRLQQGFPLQDPDEEANSSNILEDKEEDEEDRGTKLEKLAEEPDILTDHELARRLAIAIKKTANDLRADRPKKYSYEEWVEFTRLIRFSSHPHPEELEAEEEEEGLIEWDWIGEDSPMLADVTETEWVLERLCESLNRYTRKQARSLHKPRPVPSKKESANSQLRVPSYSLSSSNNIKRQNLQHDKHIDAYPAHPGPRSPHPSGSGWKRSFDYEESGEDTTGYKSKGRSLMVSRGPSGDEVMRIVHRNKKRESQSSGTVGSGSGSGGGEESNERGSSGGTTVVDALGLSEGLRAYQTHEAEASTAKVSVLGGDDSDHEEATVSTARLVGLKHLSSG